MSDNKILIASLVMITAGCSMVYLPLGPIVLGALLLVFLFWSRMQPVPKESEDE